MIGGIGRFMNGVFGVEKLQKMAAKSRKKSKKTRKKQGQERAFWQKLLSSWGKIWRDKSPVIQFLLAFSIGIGLFYWLYTSSFFSSVILEPLTNFQAKISSGILNLFGEQTNVRDGGMLTSNKVSLNIKKGCDGIEPLAFYVLGVLIIPLSWRAKIPGLLIGVSVLFVLNLLRIILLYLASSYWPQSFDLLHLHGGFALFFVITLIIWIIWAKWAINHAK